MTNDLTAKKAHEILLENKQRLKADFRLSALVTSCYAYQGKVTSSCRHYNKIGYWRNVYWKKYLKLISNQYKSEEKVVLLTPLKKALLISKKHLC